MQQQQQQQNPQQQAPQRPPMQQAPQAQQYSLQQQLQMGTTHYQQPQPLAQAPPHQQQFHPQGQQQQYLQQQQQAQQQRPQQQQQQRPQHQTFSGGLAVGSMPPNSSAVDLSRQGLSTVPGPGEAKSMQQPSLRSLLHSGYSQGLQGETHVLAAIMEGCAGTCKACCGASTSKAIVSIDFACMCRECSPHTALEAQHPDGHDACP